MYIRFRLQCTRTIRINHCKHVVAFLLLTIVVLNDRGRTINETIQLSIIYCDHDILVAVILCASVSD